MWARHRRVNCLEVPKLGRTCPNRRKGNAYSLLFGVAMQYLLLRRTTVGFVFVCAKYKCDKERPMGRASPSVTSLAVMSADGSPGFHWVPKYSRCWCLSLLAWYSQGGCDDRASRRLQVAGSFYKGHVLLGDPGALLHWDRRMKKGANSLARVGKSNI